MDHPIQSSGSGAAATDGQASRELEAIRLSGQVAIDYLLQHVPKDELAYRWIGPRALRNRQCVEHVGMFSQGQDQGPIWRGDQITMHCNNRHSNFLSNYLSMSTSPQRIVNFMVGVRDIENGEVAIINMGMLRIMQPDFARTTDLAEEFDLRIGGKDEGRTKYVTQTHYLVHHFIPASCILGYINADVFKHICLSNDINEGTDPALTRTLTWANLEPWTVRTSAFSVPSQVSTATPATPTTPATQTTVATVATPTTPATPSTPSNTRHPQTTPHSGISVRGQHQRDPWSSPTINRTSLPTTRQSAPFPSPSQLRSNVRKQDPDIIDLTKTEVKSEIKPEYIEILGDFDNISFSRTMSPGSSGYR